MNTARDWTGNRKSIYTPLGASNHSETEREAHDYYATEPRAVEILLEQETFSPHIWECACGGGHISRVLEESGFFVKNSDIIDRGYKNTEVIDFLKVDKTTVKNDFPRDIITNPPYKYAKEFVEQALKLSMDGTKIAMFLKLTFLEGQARRRLFDDHPPKKIYVFSGRVKCAKNGEFESIGASAVAYAWFVWVKGFSGSPVIRWVN